MTDENETRVQDKLDEMSRTLHQTHITVTEIKGDNKLQSQVLQFHIDQLKEFRGDITKIIENQDKKFEALANRVDKIEKWQVRVIALAAGAAAILTVVANDIRKVLFG